MTVNEFRRDCASKIAMFIPDESKTVADIFISYALGIRRSEMLAELNSQISDEAAEIVSGYIYRLSLGEPVQYILGSCWFYGKEIKVGKGVFIPRSDTEILVKAANAALPKNGVFADICSGSGCISAALIGEGKASAGYALELSRKALVYTEENLKQYENITVKRFDALDENDYIDFRDKYGKVDMIVCNPPYIPTDDIDSLDTIVRSEPESALDGGDDGLKYYRAVTEFAKIILKDDCAICYEVGLGEARDVAVILEALGYKSAVIADLNGIDRVVLGKKG